jgi:hypothetical protein
MCPELVPIRYGPDVGIALHVLSGCCVDHGCRSGGHGAFRPHGPVRDDPHLSNFGVFASPERQLMFDINDFDETLPGPWE